MSAVYARKCARAGVCVHALVRAQARLLWCVCLCVRVCVRSVRVRVCACVVFSCVSVSE